jgi:diadenosine tetraphosphate (Ap4A) HIT family hydrolase
MTQCFACANNERIGALPPREEILVSGSWRVVHAFGTSLPGWLVVLPTRHVRALHELSRDEAAQLGEVLHRASHALQEVVGCEKAYFVFFAEAEGFEHLHVHVIPRMGWFTPKERGPGVFTMLGVSPEDEVSEQDRDDLARRLRGALELMHPAPRSLAMAEEDDDDVRRTNIGGRYGSPSFTIALPFGKIVNTDNDLRDAIAELATLVARAAQAGGDEAQLALVQKAADELAGRLGS